MLVYPFSEARMVLRRLAETTRSMPDELTVQVGAIGGPDGVPVILLVPTWCGLQGEGDGYIAPLLELGTLLDNTLNAVRYGTSLSVFDPHIVNRQRTFMETCWLPTLDETGVDILVEAMARVVSTGCGIFTMSSEARPPAYRSRRPHSGSAVPTCSSKFSLRFPVVRIGWKSAGISGGCVTRCGLSRRWHFLADIRTCWGRTTRTVQSFGRNSERLVKAKKLYDPDNVFCSAIPLPIGRRAICATPWPVSRVA
jgi:hypothetical protein